MSDSASLLPSTEQVNAATRGLDRLDQGALVKMLLDEQVAAATSVLAAADAIATAIERIVECLRSGGRLHYVGAGTSGRLGYLDAAECPPTFGTPPRLVCAHIAGGLDALTRAVEGAEDDRAAGARELDGHAGRGDAVVGISASGGAPYVVAALEAARAAGAFTVGIASVAASPLARAVEVPIIVNTGAEPLAGSTRLKAGTAQKIVLNTLSTGIMVGLGKVYDNLMVDVVATNEKLRARAIRLVGQLAAIDPNAAAALLERAGGRVKVAVVMQRRALSRSAAEALLLAVSGSLRRALEGATAG